MNRFRWQDGERTIHFGRGVAADAVELVGGRGYTLLTTPRASSALPALADAAASIQHVGPGRVDDLATELLERLKPVKAGPLGDDAPGGAPERGGALRLVALGGGRIIDVAKALVAARGGSVAAVPTTLSGAEMTQNHRQARGVENPPFVRARIVVFDPALAASQPVEELAASALNALGHAVEGPCTLGANPVSTLAARDAARLLGEGFAAAEIDRDALALGGLLAGYTIDSTGLGLHHVLAQTLVREAGIGHGQANAVLIRHTTAALARRFGARVDGFAAIAERILPYSGITGLRALGVDEAVLPACAQTAAARPQLANTPPAPDAEEILEIYRAAR